MKIRQSTLNPRRSVAERSAGGLRVGKSVGNSNVVGNFNVWKRDRPRWVARYWETQGQKHAAHMLQTCGLGSSHGRNGEGTCPPDLVEGGRIGRVPEGVALPHRAFRLLYGYLVQKKTHPPRTLP